MQNAVGGSDRHDVSHRTIHSTRENSSNDSAMNRAEFLTFDPRSAPPIIIMLQKAKSNILRPELTLQESQAGESLHH
jgi:hypothetical protein